MHVNLRMRQTRLDASADSATWGVDAGRQRFANVGVPGAIFTRGRRSLRERYMRLKAWLFLINYATRRRFLGTIIYGKRRRYTLFIT